LDTAVVTSRVSMRPGWLPGVVYQQGRRSLTFARVDPRRFTAVEVGARGVPR